MKTILSFFAVSLVLLSLADEFTWAGSQDPRISVPSNWQVGGAVAERAPGYGDTLVFPSGPSARRVVNDISGVPFAGLVFSNEGEGYRICGAPIAVSNQLRAAACSTNVIESDLTFLCTTNNNPSHVFQITKAAEGAQLVFDGMTVAESSAVFKVTGGSKTGDFLCFNGNVNLVPYGGSYPQISKIENSLRVASSDALFRADFESGITVTVPQDGTLRMTDNSWAQSATFNIFGRMNPKGCISQDRNSTTVFNVENGGHLRTAGARLANNGLTKIDVKSGGVLGLENGLCAENGVLAVTVRAGGLAEGPTIRLGNLRQADSSRTNTFVLAGGRLVMTRFHLEAGSLGTGISHQELTFDGGVLELSGNADQNNLFAFDSASRDRVDLRVMIAEGGVALDARGCTANLNHPVLAADAGVTAGTFTKRGYGTVRVTAEGNTFNGPTVVAGGTLEVLSGWPTASYRLDSGTLKFAPAGMSAAPITLNDGVLTATEAVSLGAVTLNGHASLAFALADGAAINPLTFASLTAEGDVFVRVAGQSAGTYPLFTLADRPAAFDVAKIKLVGADPAFRPSFVHDAETGTVSLVLTAAEGDAGALTVWNATEDGIVCAAVANEIDVTAAGQEFTGTLDASHGPVFLNVAAGAELAWKGTVIGSNDIVLTGPGSVQLFTAVPGKVVVQGGWLALDEGASVGALDVMAGNPSGCSANVDLDLSDMPVTFVEDMRFCLRWGTHVTFGGLNCAGRIVFSGAGTVSLTSKPAASSIFLDGGCTLTFALPDALDGMRVYLNNATLGYVGPAGTSRVDVQPNAAGGTFRVDGGYGPLTWAGDIWGSGRLDVYAKGGLLLAGSNARQGEVGAATLSVAEGTVSFTQDNGFRASGDNGVLEFGAEGARGVNASAEAGSRLDAGRILLDGAGVDFLAPDSEIRTRAFSFGPARPTTKDYSDGQKGAAFTLKKGLLDVSGANAYFNWMGASNSRASSRLTLGDGSAFSAVAKMPPTIRTMAYDRKGWNRGGHATLVLNGGMVRATGEELADLSYNTNYLHGADQILLCGAGGAIENEADITVTRPVTGGDAAAGLTKLGGGTLTLASPHNRWAGPTKVVAGTLKARRVACGRHFYPAGLSALWTFDDADNPTNDVTGCGNDLTESVYNKSPVTFVTNNAHFGQSARFSGGNTLILYDYNNNWGTDRFTVSVWVRMPVNAWNGGHFGIIGARSNLNDSHAGNSFQLDLKTAQRLYLGVSNSGAFPDGAYCYLHADKSDYVPNRWYMLTYVQDDQGTHFFVDGESRPLVKVVKTGDVELPDANGIWGNDVFSTGSGHILTIGRGRGLGGTWPDLTGGGEFTKADTLIDDVAVFSRGLSAEEVAAMYVSHTNAASDVTVVERAVYDLDGAQTEARDLAGGGSVTNGTLTVVRALKPEGTLTVSDLVLSPAAGETNRIETALTADGLAGALDVGTFASACAGVVSVDIAEGLSFGSEFEVTLLDYDSLAGGAAETFSAWIVETTGTSVEPRRFRLVHDAENRRFNLFLPAGGTLLLFR